jgi:uncharacterized membrane protein
MPNAYAKAACLGVIAGMRSMTAPALISGYLDRTHSDALLDSPLEWLATPTAASVFRVLAAGERIADKLPSVPARTSPGPLIGRGVTGALSGAAVCVADGEGLVEGAVVGALAAIASTFAFYHLRRWLTEATPLPDAAVAAAEDALALGLGRTALNGPA